MESAEHGLKITSRNDRLDSWKQISTIADEAQK
jgi:hypothetical protein